MDELIRQNAKLKIENAHKLEHRQSTKERILSEYLQGINLFLKITNKTIDDFKAQSKAYYSIATIYFNQSEYTKAAQSYLDSIQQLQKTELNDNTYRTLTERYIDLADACYESLNQQGADESMANAIKAFGLIKEKNPQELAIGDPDTNFKQFHDYYERDLSTASYLKSVKFINHGMLLAERQQEKNFLAQFEGISISETKQIDDSIEHMLKQLSVSEQPQALSFFSPILINQARSDADYRNVAMQFLHLAQTHLKNNLIKNVVTTYAQVISALNSIQTPNEQDQQTVKNLKEQIVFLKTKTERTVSSSSSSSSAAASFFSQSPPATRSNSATPIDAMDEDEEVEINYMSN